MSPRRGAFFEPCSLAILRYRKVAEILSACNVSRFLDVGCGSGRGLAEILSRRSPVFWRDENGVLTNDLSSKCSFTLAVGVDKSATDLAQACTNEVLSKARAGNPYIPCHVSFWLGDVLHNDSAPLLTFLQENDVDCCVAVEVIEHTNDVGSFTEFLLNTRFRTVVVTTPNKDANVTLGMQPNQRRHDDHKFEWTEHEFCSWAEASAEKFEYDLLVSGVGNVHYNNPDATPVNATSIAVFHKRNTMQPPLPPALDLSLCSCQVPACGKCSYKNVWCTSAEKPPQPSCCHQVLFAATSHSWMAYDIAYTAYTMVRSAPNFQLPIEKISSSTTIHSILENCPNFVVEDSSRWVLECIKEASCVLHGLGVMTTNYETLLLAYPCAWCGDTECGMCAHSRI
ncbi:3primeprimeprimeprime terminal RNA ribose 2primeprimeprimeprime-O-methyltransferase Hen1 [Diplonema papillatum]|nr:3primeprimeprimeprime terminal RNA ribose 2primeprimeprimeprime-O-methyltransferase Hen1 [Diplonema papillatum]